ncbi:1283_t:CDS:2, partial [Paraglomus occultum]
PLVAEAAAQILNHSKIKFSENLEPLISFIREGLVEPGPKGELTVRILLTLAWDHTIHQKQADSLDFMYTCPLTVKEYLSALMVDLSSLKGQISPENLQVLFDGLVFFTHFIAIERGITKESLLLHCFFCHGAAIQCQCGQSVIDHGIPVILANGEFTYIIIQTHNYNFSDPNIMFTSTVITPQAAGGEIKNLYLKRVEQGIQGDKSNNNKSKCQAQLEQALTNEDIVTAKSWADYQLIVGLFGITEDVYPFLHVDSTSTSKHTLSRSSLSKKELLQKLSKTWTDPMSCAEGDKKEVVKQMMPLVLVWEGGVSKKVNARQCNMERQKKIKGVTTVHHCVL